jgi:hypothetical protein
MSQPQNLDAYHQQRKASVEAFNRSQLGLDGETRARGLKRRFRAVSRRHERTAGLHRAGTTLRRFASFALVGALAGSAMYLAIWLLSPWPVGVTLRHVVAGLNCGYARAVDLAPALRGAPGYWTKNDADKDGIACEPWPRRR